MKSLVICASVIILTGLINTVSAQDCPRGRIYYADECRRCADIEPGLLWSDEEVNCVCGDCQLFEDGVCRYCYEVKLTCNKGQCVREDCCNTADLLTKAEKGDVESQLHLAYKYYKGIGIPKNYKESKKWYSRAAENGDGGASSMLGLMYYNGKGGEKNNEKALRACQKGADAGHPLGQRCLGLMYYHGTYVNRNYFEAFKWLKRAADKGDLDAQVYLANMYLDGEGVNQNYVQSYKWTQKAADQRNPTALYNLGTLYEEGKGVVKNEAQAIKWYKEAAKEGFHPAREKLRNLGIEFQP